MERFDSLRKGITAKCESPLVFGDSIEGTGRADIRRKTNSAARTDFITKVEVNGQTAPPPSSNFHTPPSPAHSIFTPPNLLTKPQTQSK